MSTAVLPEMAYSVLLMILKVVTQILHQRTSWQIRQLGYILPHFGRVGVERACSEIGVPNICTFVRGEEKIPERPEIAQRIVSARVALPLLDALQEPRFVQTFTRKGRFKDLVSHIPIQVITMRAGLVGGCPPMAWQA